MNWLELIGAISVVSVGIYLLNIYFDYQKANDRRFEEEQWRIQQSVKESRDRELELEKWKLDNASDLEQIEKEKTRISKLNQITRDKKQEELDLAKEWHFLRSIGRDQQKHIEKMRDLNPEKWGKIESLTPGNLPKYDPEYLPWKASKGAFQNVRSMEDVIQTFLIPKRDAVILYLNYRDDLTRSGGHVDWHDNREALARVNHWLTLEEIDLATLNPDQAVINKIVVDLELLKNIAVRNHAKPIYVNAQDIL